MKIQTKKKNSPQIGAHKYRNAAEQDDIEEETEDSPKWFEQVPEVDRKYERVTDEALIELKDEARKCYDNECLNYSSKNAKTNSDYQWMKTILSKGTIADKIAAYTVSIQDNPLYNLEHIRNMVNMVKVQKKECTQIIDVLSELFTDYLLHPCRKLKQLHQQPLSLLNEIASGNAVTRKKYLTYWYFEDQLKEVYFSFVTALKNVSHDTIDANKEKAVSAMYKLLVNNAEQEKNLLANIVNKLGDPSQKVASKAIYCLTQLLHKHPNMQGVVLLEVEKLLFRTNISKRAQYYGLCFLSQFYLNHEDGAIAQKLIEVYFSFFKACIKQGDVDSRMMSALLIGVNRAYPYAKLELEKVSEHIDAMYKIVHIANFNVSLNALSLLYQVSDYCDVINDRFYSALYRKLFDPEICHTTHQAILLNMVYKALKKDKHKARVKVFIKRLLQISSFVLPALTCGILFLVSHLASESDDLKAFVLKAPKLTDNDDDDDEDEKYADVLDGSDTGRNENESEENNRTKKTDEGDSINKEANLEDSEGAPSSKEKSSPGWIYVTNKNRTKIVNKYDGLHRNPLYAGGEFCAYLELNELRKHFHPTVALYANQILNGETISYSGDPLKDFTIIRFLDRFVFKNPKKIEDVEKKGCHPTFGKRNVYLPKGVKSIPITSDSYLNENEKNIPVDELFLYTYLRKRKGERIVSKGGESDDEDDLESVGSAEFEEMLERMGNHKEADEHLDYMNEIGENLKRKGKKSAPEEDKEDNIISDEDSLQEEDGDDQEQPTEFDDIDDDDKKLIEDLSDDDMSEIEFDSDEDSEFEKGANKKKMSKDIKNLFASAEEFASLLEDEGSSKVAPGSAHAVANRDNADLKQLAWEEKRNHWIRGSNKHVKNKRKKNAKNSKNKKFKK